MDLGSAMTGLAWDLRVQRMTQRELATWLNERAIAGRTAEAYHARVAERQRYERIERERV